jgi:hypothetical protein
MNAHRDPGATYRFAAITADNANHAQQFTGAELVLLDGVLGVEIQPSDVLIIDGSRYHGVAPLRSLPGTQFKSQPLRHSLVHFTRSMHMERGSGRGEGRYWAEPEGGLWLATHPVAHDREGRPYLRPLALHEAPWMLESVCVSVKMLRSY